MSRSGYVDEKTGRKTADLFINQLAANGIIESPIFSFYMESYWTSEKY